MRWWLVVSVLVVGWRFALVVGILVVGAVVQLLVAVLVVASRWFVGLLVCWFVGYCCASCWFALVGGLLVCAGWWCVSVMVRWLLVCWFALDVGTLVRVCLLLMRWCVGLRWYVFCLLFIMSIVHHNSASQHILFGKTASRTVPIVII